MAIVVVPLTFISSLFSGVVFEGSKHTTIVFGQPVEVVDRSFGLLIGGLIVTAVISVIISAVLQAAILRAAAQATIGDPVDPQESYRFGFKRLGSVILVSLLVGLAVAGGLILLVDPRAHLPDLPLGLRAGADRGEPSRAGGAEPVVEPGEGALLARGRRDHRRRASSRGSSAGSSARSAGTCGSCGGSSPSIGTIITAPFTALVSVLLYLDLRSRSEALTADTLRTELAAAGASG